MAARRYEISLRVLKNTSLLRWALTCENNMLSSCVKICFHAKAHFQLARNVTKLKRQKMPTTKLSVTIFHILTRMVKKKSRTLSQSVNQFLLIVLSYNASDLLFNFQTNHSQFDFTSVFQTGTILQLKLQKRKMPKLSVKQVTYLNIV